MQTVTLLFFIFLGVAVISFLLCVNNMLKAVKSIKDHGDFKVDESIMVHVVSYVVVILSGIGATITGVIWIIQQFK